MKEESEKVIRLLMEDSDWGKYSSMNSLLNDFKNETEEFIEGAKKKDRSNTIEEASDVLMMMLCVIYKLEPVHKDAMIEMLTNRFIEKLYTRYPHLYGKEKRINKQSEPEIWATSKKHEHTATSMFCNNKDCSCYHQLGRSNIEWKKGRYVCTSCGKRVVVSENTILFFNHHKYRTQYINSILDSIRAFVHTGNDAVSLFVAEHEKLCSYLPNELLGTEKQLIFSEYAAEVVNCEPAVIGRYFDLLIETLAEKHVEKKNSTMDIIDHYITDYCDSIHLNKKSSFGLLSKRERDVIWNVLSNATMDINQRIEKSMTFNARSWDNQHITKFLLKIDSERIIECMAIIHYKGTTVNDMTIEVSNMYNCVVGCRFCASGALTASEKDLTPIDYLRQINTCLKEIGANPQDFTNFFVSFAGIGEPSVVYESVAEAMIIIQDIYPNVKFNIATFGFRDECFDYWRKGIYSIRTLQIPYYSHNESTLQYIVKNLPHDYSFQKIIGKALLYQESHPECRVKINYLVMSGINDSYSHVESFIQVTNEFKERVTVKISFLNFTRPGRDSNLSSPGMKRLGEIQAILAQAGYSCYVFGADTNTGLGCGQLVQNYISSEQ